MKPDVVVDVGNTRIKWGRCSADAVVAVASLPPDEPAAWEEQVRAWGLSSPASWVVTGVHPPRCEKLVGWLRQRGDDVRVIDSARQLPLQVLVEHPDRVGIDRLLNAVAANAHKSPECPAVIVDAGSAVTVDLVDQTGAFRGGAIMPGLRLMAHALHDHTALLPRIEVPREAPALPGTSTAAAVAAGVFYAWAGGVSTLVHDYMADWEYPDVFLTGGDGPLLASALDLTCWPEMTLEGIRLAAESLP
ncbi:MAG TPA: type III pantothenate kinase [Gemmataceae bacterium]|nr:type III pantothenate kinase [Gemmataceae bacterium]